jgi:hypothetical protein
LSVENRDVDCGYGAVEKMVVLDCILVDLLVVYNFLEVERRMEQNERFEHGLRKSKMFFCPAAETADKYIERC